MDSTTYSEQLKSEIWQRQKGMCGQCGIIVEQDEDTIEHTYYSLGEAGDPQTDGSDNLIMLCKTCHSKLESNESHPVVLQKKYSFPYGGFLSYPYEQLYEDVKSDMLNFIENSSSLEDYRILRSQIGEKMQLIKKLNLNPEHNEEFSSQLTKMIEDLNKKQYEESAKLEEESLVNYQNLKAKLDEAVSFAENSRDFNTARKTLINVQNAFKELRFKKEHRDELLATLNRSFEDLARRQNEERERFEMECIENYHNIKNAVTEAIAFINDTNNYSKAREILIETQKKFKGLKLKKEQREEQYAIIQKAFEELNFRQNEERKKFEIECSENYSNLRKMVDEAIAFSSNTTDFRQARESLINAQQTIKGFRLTRDQRDELYSSIRNVFDDLNRRQTDERRQFDKESTDNFIRLNNNLESTLGSMQVITDFRHIRETLIAIQSEVMIVNLKREKRNELFGKIREAFTLLDNKRNEYRQSKIQEKIDKLQSILFNLEAKASRVDDSIARDNEIIDQHNARLAELNAQDAEDKLKNEIAFKIEAIEVRIRDKELSLSEIKKRISDIKKELNAEKNSSDSPVPIESNKQADSGEAENDEFIREIPAGNFNEDAPEKPILPEAAEQDESMNLNENDLML